MNLVILMMCTVLAAGVFATMFAAIWSSRRDSSCLRSHCQNVAAELVWSVIPCLAILAAAIPVAIAIASS